MSLTVKETGGTNYPPIEAGTYPARCVGIIDLGLQHNDFNGRDVERVRIIWELPTESTQDDNGDVKPRWISKPYTASLHEKAALRRDLDAWRGKPFTQEELQGFSLKNILNAPCLLTVIHQENQQGGIYAKVGGVSKIMKGMDVPELDSVPFCFDMEDPDAMTILATLPQWMQDEIRKSSTWEQKNADKFPEVIVDEELPF